MKDVPHRRLPPLTALRALEALHLTGSVTGAAQRLRVSHSAVSHQVRILEDWSGTPLFVRRGRTTLLTDAGRSLATIAHGAFDAIRHEIDRLPLRQFRPVSVAALPIIATQLILPGLGALLLRAPEIRVHLTLALTDRPTVPAPDIEVLFVRRATQLASDLELLPGDAVPACTPALLDRAGGDTERLMRSGPLIHDEDMRMWPAWQALTGRVGDGEADGARIILEGSGLIHSAVLAGLGVGFVRRSLAAEDVAAGRLTICSAEAIDADWVYVVRPDPARATDPEVVEVVAWLRALAQGGAAKRNDGGTA
ncbi:MAG: LysR family transcriptional regulator [Jannaschia sp.]